MNGRGVFPGFSIFTQKSMMEHVVITGSSRGIGKALALEFLKRGNRVTISGRKRETVDKTRDLLIRDSGNSNCQAYVCDVTSLEDLKALWAKAVGIAPVNIWINNAGINHINHTFHQLDEVCIEQVVSTNLMGTALGSKVAIEGMLNQETGMVFNMEGFGSDGRVMKGMSMYGTSKSATRYLTRSLVKEYADTPVKIGSISPGMVVTDMLLDPIQQEPHRNRRALKVFHTLADTAERVSPWLTDQILNNRKHGTHIAWLKPRKILWRFFSSMFYNRKVEGLPDYSQQSG